jgi:hypothetical protein
MLPAAAYLSAFQSPPTALEVGPGSHLSMMARFTGPAPQAGPAVHAVSSSLVCLPADDAGT